MIIFKISKWLGSGWLQEGNSSLKNGLQGFLWHILCGKLYFLVI